MGNHINLGIHSLYLTYLQGIDLPRMLLYFSTVGNRKRVFIYSSFPQCLRRMELQTIGAPCVLLSTVIS